MSAYKPSDSSAGRSNIMRTHPPQKTANIPRAAIGAMYSMGLQAVELMQTPTGLNDGLNAGPKFKVNYEQM